ncbi:MAG: hypothetical protein WCK01_02635 [Candidatus Uhrbacteria bacterium]
MGHEFIIRVLAVAVKVEDGLTFVLEFLNILANASIGLIEFLVAILPRIKNNSLEQLFVLGVGLNGFQELNEFLLESTFLYGFGVRAFLAPVVIVRITLAVTTSSIASRERLIAMLANDETPQGKIRIIENARLAFEMISALHVLALSEQRLVDNRFKTSFSHLLKGINSTAIHGVCDDFFERLLKRIFPSARA